VSEPKAAPKWNTTPLWGVLAALLLFGTLGGATFVFGLVEVLGQNLFGIVPAAIGGIVAFLAFLFLAGILYRVDRYRGANLRRVELFE
jgi:hypothetical protein